VNSSARRRPDESDADRVLHYIELYAGEEKLTHQLIASVLGLHPRWVFEIVSQLDGTRALLGGLPASGYRLAEYREDAERRNAAIGSQIEEMRQRLRRRKAFARTLPKRPAPPSNGAAGA
jgi:hypothetical protein